MEVGREEGWRGVKGRREGEEGREGGKETREGDKGRGEKGLFMPVRAGDLGKPGTVATPSTETKHKGFGQSAVQGQKAAHKSHR